MVLSASIHSPSGERLPISFWEISALYMCMVTEGPFTGCSALPSQLTSGCGTRASPVGLSPWDLQEQECWAPSVPGRVYWVQTPGALSSSDFQCNPVSSVFPYILPTTSFPLVQVNRVRFFACERRMLSAKHVCITFAI